MKDGLKKLITKYGGTYTQYDNTTYDLLIQLCSALKLPYDKYMDEDELFTLIAERGIVPGSGGESGGESEGDSGGESETVNTWDNIFPNKVMLGNHHYVDSNGIDAYYSYAYNSNNYGLYHHNMLTGVDTKIITISYSAWSYFYKDLKGNLYVSSSDDYHSGIYLLQGASATRIYNNSYKHAYWYEDDQGYIYVSSSDSRYGTGILCIYNGTVTKIYNNNYTWNRYYSEDGKHILLYSSSNNNGVLLCYNGEASLIHSEGAWPNQFNDTSGNTYINTTTSSLEYQTLRLNVDHVTPYKSPSNATYTYIDEDTGVLYITGYNTTGIASVYNGVVNLLYSGGGYYTYYWKDSKGNLYTTSGSMSYGKGLLKINKDEAIVVWAEGGYFIYHFEDSKGNLYVSGVGANSGTPLFCVQNDVGTQIYDTGTGWTYFIEGLDGSVYVTGSPYTGNGILLLNGTEPAIAIETTGHYSKPIMDSRGNIYMSGDSNGQKRLFHVKDGVATRISSADIQNIVLVYENTDGYVYTTSRKGSYVLKDTTCVSISANLTHMWKDADGTLYSSSTLNPVDGSTIYIVDKTTATEYTYKTPTVK